MNVYELVIVATVFVSTFLYIKGLITNIKQIYDNHH